MRQLSLFQTASRLLAFLLVITAAAIPSAAQENLSLYGPSGIGPTAVRQGTLGSCFFHASLAAVAKSNPDAIRRALSGDLQRGFQVHFVNGPQELVYRADVEYARSHNYDRSEGVWVTVLMRGYAQRELRRSMIEAVQRSTSIPSFAKPVALSMLQQSGPLLLAYDRAVRSVVSQDGQMDRASFDGNLAREIHALGIPAAQAQIIGNLLDRGGLYNAIASTVQKNGEVFGAYRGLGQGGIPISVLEALLGNAHSLAVSDSGLTHLLQDAHANRAAVVAGTRSSSSSNGANWYVGSHAYTVLDYDPSRGSIELRNPWASRPAPDGVFWLPLPTFRSAFDFFSYHDDSD